MDAARGEGSRSRDAQHISAGNNDEIGPRVRSKPMRRHGQRYSGYESAPLEKT